MARDLKELAELKELFPGRVTFDALERRIHSHDVGSMPKMVRPLIGPGVADAIVKPESEEELQKLVSWAAEHQVPLTPRAKATSGYGGVIPVEGGIEVDLNRLRAIVNIDAEALTATVQPSIVWQDLEAELRRQGLALRLYPSSAPSSTVGGWLAQGGAGYGSYEYGCFRDNVVSARVLLPNGEERTFTGEDLDLVSEAEGITGIILEVTLRVRRAAEERIYGAEFGSAQDLAGAIRLVAMQGAPLWSVSFINPKMAELKNQLKPKATHMHDAGAHRPKLPPTWVAIFVGPAERAPEIERALGTALMAHNGRLLPAELAAHEWAERFDIMHVKRLGPSLVPAEVTVPLEGLGDALDDILAAVKQPIVMEGLLARRVQGGFESTLLGFIPHDERTLTYNLAFGLALSVLAAAKKHGGRAYATGLYFRGEAAQVFGSARLSRLSFFKAQVDPKGIMNPGKILGASLLSTFMTTAQVFEPMVRLVANEAKSPIGERPQGQGKRDVPDAVAWDSWSCAQCGYCVDQCPQYTSRTWESQAPRGKFFTFRDYMEGKIESSQEFSDAVFSCTLCARCAEVCPVGLDTRNHWIAMREQLVAAGHFPQPLATLKQNITTRYNISGEDNAGRMGWSQNLPVVPEGLAGRQAEMVYFVGCVGALYPQAYGIPQSMTQILMKAGADFTTLGAGEWCCGYPLLIAGMREEAKAMAKHNVEAVRALGAKTVVTTCPSCLHIWKHEYPRMIGGELGFAVRHATEVLADLVSEGKLKLGPYPKAVTYHDPCDLGRNNGIYEAPRQVLRAIPDIKFTEMRDNRELSLCCGGGGDVEMCDADLTASIGKKRLGQAQEIGAEVIVSACQQCKRTLTAVVRREKARVRVLDITEIVAQVMRDE